MSKALINWKKILRCQKNQRGIHDGGRKTDQYLGVLPKK